MTFKAPGTPQRPAIKVARNEMSYLAARVNGKVDVFDIMWLPSRLPTSLSSEVAQYRVNYQGKGKGTLFYHFQIRNISCIHISNISSKGVKIFPVPPAEKPAFRRVITMPTKAH